MAFKASSTSKRGSSTRNDGNKQMCFKNPSGSGLKTIAGVDTVSYSISHQCVIGRQGGQHGEVILTIYLNDFNDIYDDIDKLGELITDSISEIILSGNGFPDGFTWDFLEDEMSGVAASPSKPKSSSKASTDAAAKASA